MRLQKDTRASVRLGGVRSRKSEANRTLSASTVSCRRLTSTVVHVRSCPDRGRQIAGAADVEAL